MITSRKDIFKTSLILLASDYFQQGTEIADIYEPISIQSFNEDSRLQIPINLRPQHAFLKSILQDISIQSNIDISCSERMETGGETVTIHIRDKPLLHIMEALWSLNSFKNGEWQWERTTAKPFKYRLSRTRGAVNLIVSLQEKIDSDFLEYAKYALDLSDNDSSEKSAEFSNKVSNEAYVKDILKVTKSMMSDSSLKDLLKSGKTDWINISSLPAQSQKYIKTYWDKLNPRDSQGEQKPLTAIQFHISRSRISPELIVFAGNSSEGSGYSFIGYANRKDVLQNFLSGWNFNKDIFNIPLIDVPAAKGNITYNTLSSALMRATDSDKEFSFIAHTPDVSRYEKVNQGTDDFLSLLSHSDKNNPIWKTRNGIFLMSYPGWFLGDSHINRVPIDLFLSFEKKLESKKIDPLSIDDLISASQEFNPFALEKHTGKFQQFHFVIQWSPLFQWLSSNKQRRASFIQGTPIEVPKTVFEKNRETCPNLILLREGQYYVQFAREKANDKRVIEPIDTIHILNSKKQRVLSVHLTLQPTDSIRK